MKIRACNSGYTVVEVMIFLVVSGFILASALVAFNGRQFQVQYEQGVRELDLRLLSLISNVSNGRFSSESGECRSDVPGPLQFSATPTDQGTSDQCVYAGIAVELTGDETLTVTPIAAAKQRLGRSLSILDPAARLTPITNLASTYVTYAGLEITKIVDANGDPIQALLVLSNLGQAGAPGSAQVGSGIQSINLYASTSNIQDNVMVSPVLPPKPIFLCLESNNSERQAVITLGNQGRELTTSLDQDAEGKYTQCD